MSSQIREAQETYLEHCNMSIFGGYMIDKPKFYTHLLDLQRVDLSIREHFLQYKLQNFASNYGKLVIAEGIGKSNTPMVVIGGRQGIGKSSFW